MNGADGVQALSGHREAMISLLDLDDGSLLFVRRGARQALRLARIDHRPDATNLTRQRGRQLRRPAVSAPVSAIQSGVFTGVSTVVSLSTTGIITGIIAGILPHP